MKWITEDEKHWYVQIPELETWLWLTDTNESLNYAGVPYVASFVYKITGKKDTNLNDFKLETTQRELLTKVNNLNDAKAQAEKWFFEVIESIRMLLWSSAYGIDQALFWNETVPHYKKAYKPNAD
jgi:hypothetical protein